jgi:hypothetical protein
MDVHRFILLGTGPSVGLDRRIDRIGFACLRGRQCKPGDAAGGCRASGDGAED